MAPATDDGVLPRDVLYEVLLRLPADVLCRLRLVCRSWRSLTSDPTFAKAHSSLHPLVVGVRYVTGRQRRHRSHDHELQLVDPLSGNIVKRFATGQAWDVHESTAHLGLLCISKRCAVEKACVLNPSTGPITMLRTTASAAIDTTRHQNKSISIWYIYALGWVPSTGEYKVLRVRLCHRWHLLDREVEQTYHITTLGGVAGGHGGGRDDAGWRAKPCPPDWVAVALAPETRAVVKGVVYFLLNVDTAKSDDIAMFDLATEEWRQPVLRGPLGSHHITATMIRCFNLANLNGCLVSICNYTWGCHDDVYSMDLWFLEDVDKELWTKRYSLQSPFGHPDRLFTLWILADERILAWVDGVQELRAYDPRTKTWTNLSTVQKFF